VTELVQQRPAFGGERARTTGLSSHRPRLAWPRLLQWDLAVVAAGSVVLSAVVDDWLAGAVIVALWFGYRMLVFPGSTPVLILAFTFQWIQVSLGVLYYGLTGRELLTIAQSDYRPMVLIGLGCLIVIALGLRLGIALIWRHRAPGETWPHEAMIWPVLLGAYILLLSSEAAIKNFAWDNPSITQAVLTVDMARLGLLFLVFRRLTRPAIRWYAIGLVLGVEIAMGLIGYFAGFREPLVLLMLALLEVFDRRKLQHRVALALIVALSLGLGLMWMGIRTEYRSTFTDADTIETWSSKRFGRVQDLSSNWFNRGSTGIMADLDKLVDRMWTVYYPALALARVPAHVPHTNGALLWGVIEHITMPRIFFPDKPALPSNSELVRRYSGVWVAGPEQNTSIAFGYAAESYVDFGVPLMFLPIMLFAVFMGMIYAWLMNHIYHRELAVALTTVIFWLSLYLFERSWAKMLGDALTMMLYLGTATVLMDRLLLTKVLKSEAAPRGAV
jgi:hypothetical protein